MSEKDALLAIARRISEWCADPRPKPDAVMFLLIIQADIERHAAALDAGATPRGDTDA